MIFWNWLIITRKQILCTAKDSMNDGFSLIEILTVLSLISLIFLGTTSFLTEFMNNHKRWQMRAENELEITSVIKQITHSIMHAGFTPCFSINCLTKNINVKAIEVGQNNLTIHRMSEYYEQVKKISDNVIFLESSNTFYQDQKIIISNCKYAFINKIKSIVKGNIIFLANPPNFDINKAFIGTYIAETFFTKENKLYYKLGNNVQLLSSIIKNINVDKGINDNLITVKLTTINNEKYFFNVVARCI